MRIASNIALLLVSTVAALWIGDWLLGRLGYPDEQPVRAAHPPGFAETREYIEFRYRFETNSGGLRYRELPRAKSGDRARVLVLGDSYTEGLGVESGDRFTDRLERRFESSGPAIAFINGGLSGTSPRYYARLLKYVGLGYQPDGILVCVFANDVGNTLADPSARDIDPPPPSRSGVKKLLRSFLPHIYTALATVRSQRDYRERTATTDFIGEVSARARQDGVSEARIERWGDSLPLEIVDAINHGRFGFGVLSYGLTYPEFWADSLDIDNPRAEAKWHNVASSLGAMVSMAAGAGAEMAVAFVPVHFQYDASTHRPDNIAVRTGTIVRRAWLTGPSEFERRLERWAKGHGLPYFTLTDTFREAMAGNEVLDYPLDGHWTAAGHAVAADALERWLQTGNVFSFISPAHEGASDNGDAATLR